MGLSYLDSTLRRNISLTSSGSKSKPTKKLLGSTVSVSFFLALLLCSEAEAVFLRKFGGLSHTIVRVAIAPGEKVAVRNA
jgi:hypothetical protein